MSDLADIKQKLGVLEQEFNAALNLINSSKGLEGLRIKYLGRKGSINAIFSEVAGLSPDAKAEVGRLTNALKSQIMSLLDSKESAFKIERTETGEEIDITMPGHNFAVGSLHPITKTTNDICSIFTRLGFSIIDGPEIDTEYYNFEALNIPLEHPSRDAFDTFYLQSTRAPEHQSTRLLLRSHTSPVQIHAMEEYKPPLALVVPGKVYRPDAVDASHSFMFHQIEGLLVDKNTNFAQLKGTLSLFVKEFFGAGVKMRFRPHFFPFTEPSAELDISCIICKAHQRTSAPAHQKKHCSVCGGKGWLEILGCGMVHPNVFKKIGIDPDKWQGFAFGMGVERICMLKYGIDDIRLFFENDIRFLKQF